MSLVEPDKSPYWTYKLDKKNYIIPIIDEIKTTVCRQSLPKTYVLNGAVYVAEYDWILKNKTFITKETVGYVMEKEYSVDIDTEIDFKLAEILLNEQMG